MTTYLVLGGTGKTGRRVVDQLRSAGHTVRAAARTPGAASPGVEPVQFDWADPLTHQPALSGTEAVYIIPPALQVEHAEQIAALGRLAVDSGVQRAVLLSARGVDKAPDNAMFRSEQALAATGLPTVVLRPAWFAQNFTEAFFAPSISADGTVVAPTGDGANPFIDADDIAAVAVAGLTGTAAAGAYDLSGPRALSFAEAATVLSSHTGREVHHVDLPVEAWTSGAVDNGLPAPYAHILAGLFALIRDGHDAHLSDGVERALGRPGTSFEDWAAREAGSLR
ncbi:MAG: NAD(P)H-binding protein [Nocardioides sp.]|nr:NAD(P)H-binding protein [Nocardioides sp.]